MQSDDKLRINTSKIVHIARKSVSTQNDKGVAKLMDMMKQGTMNPQDAQNAYQKWKQTGVIPTKK